MGGRMKNKQNATHFVVFKNRLNLFKQEREETWKVKHVLNLKFIFHSFYFMTKMNENDPEYTELF
jgi:hypothetical protein